MKYLSLFSGVEAASLAWEPLGWEPLAFAEIEPFPNAVLAYHWPDVENLGDVTQTDWESWLARNGRPDVMVAGSPCQAFSVAGNRMSLEDARGNLSLFTAELVRFLEPRFFVWENVPGALNTRDNAFGCLLGELVGAGEPLSPTGKRWERAGLVSGPEARACWRVLDAQYFGLAQRRKRIYVVRCPRDGADPAEVLLERESVFGHPAPSREARTRPPRSSASGARSSCLLADTGVVRGLKSRFGTSGSDLDDAEAGHLVPVAFSCKDSAQDAGEIAPTLRAMPENLGVSFNGGGQVAVATWWDGSDVAECLDVAKLVKQQAMPEKARFAAILTGDDVADPVSSSEGKTYTHEGTHNFRLHNVVGQTAVRRLTPRECERLQGFPDDHTRIPWRGKAAEDCPDGPRYRAIGNSMAVPVMAWIGRRIDKVEGGHGD